MARFEDALTGWEIFRDRSGEVSKNQINAALRSRGREPISDRTYTHYSKLLVLGYSDYVPINRLDIRHANESIFDDGDRARYSDREISSPGRLLLPRASDVLTLNGQIGRVSEGYATLRVERSNDALEAARATKYDKGILTFDEVGVERAVQVTEALDRGPQINLVLAFRSLLETDHILPESPLGLTSTRVVINLGPAASLAQVLGTIRTTFDLFESVRGLVDITMTTALGATAPPTPTPRVRHLEFANPLEVILVGGMAIAGAVGYVVTQISNAVSSAADAASKVQAVGHERNDEQRRAERHQLAMRSLQLDNLKKRVELSEMLERIQGEIPEIAGVEISDLPPGQRARAEGFKDQAVEAAMELVLNSRETCRSLMTSLLPLTRAGDSCQLGVIEMAAPPATVVSLSRLRPAPPELLTKPATRVVERACGHRSGREKDLRSTGRGKGPVARSILWAGDRPAVVSSRSNCPISVTRSPDGSAARTDRST